MPELTWVYGLISTGVVFGAGVGALVWMIGYAISAIYNLIKRG